KLGTGHVEFGPHAVSAVARGPPAVGQMVDDQKADAGVGELADLERGYDSGRHAGVLDADPHAVLPRLRGEVKLVRDAAERMEDGIGHELAGDQHGVADDPAQL